MFEERKRKFALLSILSALVAVSGVSIYAQSDSDLTTFEEEAINAGVDEEKTGLADDKVDTSVASDDNATDEMPDISSLFAGLQVCNVGTARVSGETEVASVPDNATAPTISVEVMTETEAAALAGNETDTASADNETSIASAQCIVVGESAGDNETSTSSDADSANATSTASNATSSSNMTSMDNATSTTNATSTMDTSNATSTTSTAGSDEQEILVIEGQDFAPGQVVLIFSGNSLLGIDDVDPDGNIEAKVPMPDSETEVAGNDTAGIELRFVESGTQRTATFEFDGETLTASEGGDIEAADEAAEMMPAPAPAPSSNATSTNNTSNYTVQ